MAGRQRECKYVYAKTRAEVAEKLAKVFSDHRAGQLVADEQITAQRFLETWLESVKRSIAFSTWQRYGTMIRLHAVPSIGRLRLTRLSPLHLEQLYTGRLDRGLSPTTVLQLHRIMHHALRDAMRWNLVQRNVTELVTPPRKANYEFQVLSSEEAPTFLDVVKGNCLEALYVLAITTGMREGELFGLRWADVNMTTRSLHLIKQLKTKSSRQVLLPRIAAEVLTVHHARQAVGRARPGTEWDDRGPVFTNTLGRPLHPRNFLLREFYPLLEQAGLPRMRVPRPALRHSAATLLLALGSIPRSLARCWATVRSASRWTSTLT